MALKVKMIIETETAPGKTLPPPSQVTVREQLRQPTSFSITYTEDVCQGDFQRLVEESFDPFKEVAIAVEVGGVKTYLVKGLVQGQQITIKHGGQGSQVVVSGSDNSMRMDWVTEIKDWGKKLEQEEIVTLLSGIHKHKDKEKDLTKAGKKIGSYPFVQFNVLEGKFKIGNKGKPVPIEGEEAADGKKKKPAIDIAEGQIQRATDLQFIQQWAQKYGKYFWITYDQEGGEIANFERLPLDKEGLVDLVINHEYNSMDEFSIDWNADRPTSVKSQQTDKRTKKKKESKVEQPPQPKLANRTLSELTHGLVSTLLPGPADDEDTMQERNEAALNEAEWFINASCATTYERLYKYYEELKKVTRDDPAPEPELIIHAHTIANVRGVGSRHSGKYLISGVTHTLDGESYKMQLSLMRNSWQAPEKNE